MTDDVEIAVRSMRHAVLCALFRPGVLDLLVERLLSDDVVEQGEIDDEPA